MYTYGSLLDGGEDTGRLDDVFGSGLGPRNGLGVALAEDGDLVSVDDQSAVLGLNLSLESAVGRVVLEHVDHVVETNEGIIDRHDRRSTLDRGPQDETSDTPESVDSNFAHGDLLVRVSEREKKANS